MQTITGILRKMEAQFAKPIEYSLVLNEHKIPLNNRLGRHLQLCFTGNIYCIQCNRKTKQSFQQGYCYPCMQRLAECNFCVIHPEKCNVAHAACPENDWAHAQCAQPHIVYLANSSGLKVGITRHTQQPTRWIDQGACQALPIFKVANRYQSGAIEVCLKQLINDKTDWRKLIKQSAAPLDLLTERAQLLTKAEAALNSVLATFPKDDIIRLTGHDVTELNYPLEFYPSKIVSLSFDKAAVVSGNLQGIKGQYLFFDTGVINIRKFSGYEVTLDLNEVEL